MSLPQFYANFDIRTEISKQTFYKGICPYTIVVGMGKIKCDNADCEHNYYGKTCLLDEINIVMVEIESGEFVPICASVKVDE